MIRGTKIKNMERELYIWRNIGIGKNSSVKEKEIATKEFLESNTDYNFYEVCKVIGLNKGTYYNFINHKVEKTVYEINDEKLLKEIKIIFEENNGRYGLDKMKIALQRKGIITSARKIGKLMKDNNIVKNNKMKRPKPDVYKERRKYYRNLLNRQFEQKEPNRVWVSDFLEINVQGAKFYLCTILDLFSRKVIAFRLAHKLSENLAINTFKDAFEARNEPIGLMFHSDQGGQFTSHKFMKTLKMLGVRQSFSYPGIPNDNACMEGFYSVLRREEININIGKYENSRVIKDYLSSYFDWYNNKRIHRSLEDRSPQEVENKWLSNQNG